MDQETNNNFETNTNCNHYADYKTSESNKQHREEAKELPLICMQSEIHNGSSSFTSNKKALMKWTMQHHGKLIGSDNLSDEMI